jgi:hypothetical protein
MPFSTSHLDLHQKTCFPGIAKACLAGCVGQPEQRGSIVQAGIFGTFVTTKVQADFQQIF